MNESIYLLEKELVLSQNLKQRNPPWGPWLLLNTNSKYDFSIFGLTEYQGAVEQKTSFKFEKLVAWELKRLWEIKYPFLEELIKNYFKYLEASKFFSFRKYSNSPNYANDQKSLIKKRVFLFQFPN